MAVQDEVPKSRLTLTYKTEVDGEPETVNLPMRTLIMGDLSLGTSKDRKVDFDERRLRSLDGTNLNGVMKDMDMKLEISVPNKVDPSEAENLNLELDIDSIKAFDPDQLVQRVPKLKALLLLKKLLNEVQSNMANVKEFRKLLSDAYADEEAFNKMKEQLQGFEGLKIPAGATAGGGDSEGGGEEGGGEEG